MTWIHLAQNSEKWRAVVNKIVNNQVALNRANFLNS
jgi:hypothetical protein